MPSFGRTSRERLLTCDGRLITVLSDVIQHVDFAVLCGHRGEDDQERAYKEGKSRALWGQSPHNRQPSLAVDIAPYHPTSPHIRWHDREAFHRLAGAVLYAASLRGIDLAWGGSWRGFPDLPHFELKGWHDE